MTARGRHILGIGALAGAGGSLAAILIDPTAWLACYLAAFVAVSAIPVGSLAMLLITYLVRGRWTEELYPPFIAAALTMPAAGLLAAPVLIGIPWLYPWTTTAARPGALQAVYLAPWFFIARTVVYFALWTAVALAARNAYGNPGRMIRIGSVGLILYGLTASFAGIDWVESLTPHFHSSIYGLLFITFQLLAGAAFGTFVVLRRGAAPWRYGEVLLSIMLFWAYIQAMQYIVIWAGNIPNEVSWYLARASGAWGGVLWALVLLQFVLPFFALLSERVRYGRRPLLVVAGATLALRFVESFWLVLPGTPAGGPVLLLAVPAAVLAAGAAWLLAFGVALDCIEPRTAAGDRTAMSAR